MLFRFIRKNLFFSNRVIWFNLAVSVILNLAMWIGLYFQIAPRVEPVALRYTIYFGIDLIGPWWQVFLFPAMGLAIIIINLLLAYFVFLKVKILSYILILTASLAQGLLVIISALVILLNK